MLVDLRKAKCLKMYSKFQIKFNQSDDYNTMKA